MEQPRYKNFNVALYARSFEVVEMSDLNRLKERLDLICRYVKVSKIYLETHRDMVIVEESTLVNVRNFLQENGIGVSGGIAVTINEKNHYQTYCYSNPEHRQKLKEVVMTTAHLFDEVILDDFFFTNCKCPLCIAEKGNKSWTNFRLEQMTLAAQELVLTPARAANPKVEVVIKFPNWYEHFQGLGFNLEKEPELFDAIYTGNETRDPEISNQHLQQYESYLIYRYFENIKPGKNRGGWVDTFGSQYLDRYTEQLWLTLFAKAPEITLFDFKTILRPIQEKNRAPWQGNGTSFDYDSSTAEVRQPDESLSSKAIFALAAGAAFDIADQFVGSLGNPVGLKAYKPFHSSGEDFLHNYLGMLGIPLDLVPQFPNNAATVLLTEAAKYDPRIVEKIKQQLMDGKDVVISSGLLYSLKGKGIEDIVELDCTSQKLFVDGFLMDRNHVLSASHPILMPKINFLTNDSWEEISCLAGTTGTPLLLVAPYGRGKLTILTIPDNFNDLYALPVEVLTRIKEVLLKDICSYSESPAKIALFAYDNDIVIVESFLGETVDGWIVLDEGYAQIQDTLSGEVIDRADPYDEDYIPSGKTRFPIMIKPHSFRVFQGGKSGESHS